LPVLIRSLARVFAGVLALGTFVVLGDATASSATGTNPTVTNVSPNTGPTTGGTAITITGTGFVAGATVVIGQGNGPFKAAAATNVNVVSSTEITATSGGGAIAGTFSLFVTSSGGTSAGNSDDDFTYSPVEFTASVRGITPNSGPTSGGTAITITGIFFASPATVVIGQGEGTVGAIAATNVVVVSSTEITATTGGGAKAGTFSLYVTTNNGVSSSSSRDDFTYESG